VRAQAEQAITLLIAIQAKFETYRTTATSPAPVTPSAGRAAITEGPRRRGPSGASAATSADPATLPAAISAIAVRRENDGTRLAPTWKVVTTMLAPTKIRNRSAVDCVWPAGSTGRMSAAFTALGSVCILTPP